MSVATFFHRQFCAHEVYIENLRRLSPTKVVANCNRCGAELAATYGLALPAKLLQKPVATPPHEVCARPGHPEVCAADDKVGCCFWKPATMTAFPSNSHNLPKELTDMKIKTQDLKGKALDYAVALALGYDIIIKPSGAQEFSGNDLSGEIHLDHGTMRTYWLTGFNPSADDTEGWAITGPILSQHHIQLDPSEEHWWGFKRDLALDNTPGYSGNTIQADQEAATAPEAVLRCFVQWKLGKEVEIPGEVNLKINGAPGV